ncbi:MAG: SET domain-containing protein-lysine N-methyltransferase [Gemmatimonadota bacterium]
MFLIPTVLRRSPIHGTGVFAAADVPAGTRVWEFTSGIDWEMTADQLEAFPEPFRGWLSDLVYQTDDGMYVLCGDAGRYMNHSFEPNCDDREDGTWANRDITAGEELTCDYRSFDLRSRLDGLEEWRAQRAS